jgi:competence protein ComEC
LESTQRNVQVVPALAGTRVQLDEGVELEIAGVPEIVMDTHNLSVRLVYGTPFPNGMSFLLAGDSAPLRNGGPPGGLPSSAVLRLARHGSQWANSPEILAAVNPSVAIISVDADNRYGLPSPDFCQRLWVHVAPSEMPLARERFTLGTSFTLWS